MTIKVTITNNENVENPHYGLLRVTGGAGDIHHVGPGKTVETNVWLGNPIKIEEIVVIDEKVN